MTIESIHAFPLKRVTSPSTFCEFSTGPAVVGRDTFVHGSRDRWWRHDQGDRVPWNLESVGIGGVGMWRSG